eukprot:CAMPEP_0197633650 /NCGR_PEP_ID=MMETSP1338-20131121/9972_1 /TAXON_ID=43686 ORGANISM="Pelagodinium beii, Strain RCC1491" /NCGR_SAMPLE_ID=MMETSP1338 /ASSEMBLY_ACC=CAM_ASM_000754 /LENGTH=328 /DNA_ID=CAMNT_0043205359 /DNA_START=1 /DNA_END=983 /DNA_ORIENTATION=+
MRVSMFALLLQVAVGIRANTEVSSELDNSQKIFNFINVSPYDFSEFSRRLEILKSKLEIAELKDLHLGEVINTPDEVRKTAVDRLEESPKARSYAVEIDNALFHAKLVNRALVLEDEVFNGREFTSLGMAMQTTILAMLLPNLRNLGTGLNVLFGGCGIGDWAAEVALELDETSRIWCWSSSNLSTSLGEKVFLNHDLEDIFDVAMIQSSPDAEQMLAAAIAVRKGSKLKFRCTSPNLDGCSGNFLTTDIGKSVERFTAGQGYDMVAYGNALTPEELPAVRQALRKDGFALIPVCLAAYQGDTSGTSAPWYCSGSFWKIGQERVQDQG